ncbi:uncharacterized protein LOC122378902 isoform X1 [Amphibalanus amphitrite]|uniref:uncharacterized protein LOC122378902 isoform X1 n=1 Tax=Amphibalanus amphitrite TaxID=1232801 RepID=UPI001C90C861|nr:uncharacterized protein LOC122378902 isoform X1 [Amphibalanus amphitrite]
MRHRRLPFGLNIAPNIWQRTMDSILQGLKSVACYLDDILVTGSSRQEHVDNLEQLLSRLQQYGVRLRREKCRFFQRSVEFLGYTHHRGSATERKEAQVASATAKDPVLSVVLGWARTGAWPGHANDSRLKPYLQRREQLTVIDGCVQLELPGSARYSSPSDTAVPPSVKRAGGVSGQPVLVRDLRPAATEKWQRAVVVAIGGPLTYSVRLPDSRIRLAHVDHLLADGSASVTAERGPLDARVTVPPPTEPGKLRGPAVPCVMDARGRFPYISDYNKRATCEGNRGARASEPVEAAPALRRSARLAKKKLVKGRGVL